MLITFSGVDGGGKSTQIELLRLRLAAAGQRPFIIWTRGGYTPLFNQLKTLLRRLSSGRAVPAAGPSAARSQAFSRPAVRRLWLALALLDLLLVYGLQLRWRRRRGQAIICDRYLWDTLIDFRLHFPGETVERWPLWRLLVRATPRPDAAFLLLVPVEESLRRSQLKDEPFPDPPERLAARLAHYQALAAHNHWHLLDGQADREELAAMVWGRVSGKVGEVMIG